jgi:hypothetical protein
MCCVCWQGYKKEKDEGLSHLRDTLVLRDFVRDVQGMLSQQVWEDVPPPPPSSSSGAGAGGLAVAGTALSAGIETQRRKIKAALQGTVNWLAPGAGAGGNGAGGGDRECGVHEHLEGDDAATGTGTVTAMMEQLARDEEQGFELT